MTIQWALIANSSFAQIFEIKNRGREIKEIWQLENPDAKKKISEIVSDRPGRVNSSVGRVKHALSNEVDIHSYEQKQLAAKIAAFLEMGRQKKSFDELVLIAAPELLGEIRAALPDTVKGFIDKELNKDLPNSLTQQQRIEYLKDCLGLWNFA